MSTEFVINYTIKVDAVTYGITTREMFDAETGSKADAWTFGWIDEKGSMSTHGCGPDTCSVDDVEAALKRLVARLRKGDELSVGDVV